MPTFEIKTPKGTFSVTAPDEQAALNALQQAGEMDAPKPAVPGVTGNDIADSGLTGLRQGVESTAGMFGDAAKMTGDIVGWGAGKLGASPETQDWARTLGRRINPFGFAATTEEIQSAVTKPVIGEHYQPKTVAGEYARTVGQFAPAALAGPGGVVRKTAATVIPAVTSEAAGQAARKFAPEYEQYARAGGALAGGVTAAGRARSPMPKAPATAADDLGAQASALYQKADDAGITIKPNTFNRVAANIELAAGKINKDLRPNTAGIVEDVIAMRGKPVTLQELDELRQTVGLAMKRAQPQDVRTLERIKTMLDDFADNRVVADDITGDIKGFEYIKEARGLWARKKKVELVDEILDLADVKTGRYTQSKLANTIREKMDGLYTQIVKGKQKGWTKEEIALIRQMAKGGSNSDMVNWLAKFSPRGPVSAVLGPAIGGGLTAINPAFAPLMAAIPAAGYVAGRAADRGAVAASQNLRSAAATGAVPQAGKGPVNIDALIRTLLAAQSGQNSAIANTPVR